MFRATEEIPLRSAGVPGRRVSPAALGLLPQAMLGIARRHALGLPVGVARDQKIAAQ